MRTWTIHYLNARSVLDPFRELIDSALLEVSRRAEKVADPLVLDIVVRPSTDGSIPELGLGGFTPGPGILMLAIDPVNSNLPENLGEPLERTIAHELHHAMRWESAGYGSTLGEALVSEGLAGRFVQELYGTEGEPWERAIGRKELEQFAALACRRANNSTYSHAAWFFGKGDLPRWVGYTLGWEMVGDFLRNHPGERPSGLAAISAEQILPSLEALAK